jgi:hypothetical protein
MRLTGAEKLTGLTPEEPRGVQLGRFGAVAMAVLGPKPHR